MWFQQVHQPYVTPGNRAAAVVAGINIIVFSTIALLAHREKLAKKRNNQVPEILDSSEPTALVNNGNEKTPGVEVLALQSKNVEPLE